VVGEFDSDETVDWWGKGCGAGNDWWQCFHEAVDDTDAKARAKMDGLDAIAIGQLTIDGNNLHSYNLAQSELHPLWALMIHVRPSNVDDDKWAFFVRNSGDEGYCGNSQWKVFTGPAGQPQPLKFFIPMAGVTGIQFLPSTKVNKSLDLRAATEPVTNVAIGTGATLTFNIGDPAARSWVEGELHIKWEVAVPEAFRRVPLPPSSTASAAVRANLEPREPEAEGPIPADAEAKFRSLSPQAKERYLERLQNLVPPRPSIRMDVQMLNAAVTVGKAPRGSGGRIEAIPDPAAAARQQSYLHILDEVIRGR
jgi:hypothetical protein